MPDGVIVLSRILHDWNDELAARILGNCRVAMSPGARVLIIEMLVPSAGEPSASPGVDWRTTTMDLEMLTIVGGRERTADEYHELLTRAGFELTRILALEPAPWAVVEATAV